MEIYSSRSLINSTLYQMYGNVSSIKKGLHTGDQPCFSYSLKLLHVHMAERGWQKYVEGCAVQPWFPGPGAELGNNAVSVRGSNQAHFQLFKGKMIFFKRDTEENDCIEQHN